MPKPLPYPPSDAIAAGRPIASWAVLGYPLLAVGALGALLGGGGWPRMTRSPTQALTR